METKAKSEKRYRHHDRVLLHKENLTRVDGWIEQITNSTKGVVLTRKDVVNWLVSNQADDLPGHAVTSLRKQFFNEIKFLQAAIQEVKIAKLRGETSSLSDILVVGAQSKGSPTAEGIVRKRNYRSSKKAVVSCESSDILSE